MNIHEKNKHLINYKCGRLMESKMSDPIEKEVEREEILKEQGYIKQAEDTPDRHVLSADGSRELDRVFNEYNLKLRKILMDNQNMFGGNNHIINVSQVIESLGLRTLDDDLAKGWIDYFVRCLKRDGFFGASQTGYTDNRTKFWYRYSAKDEMNFISEKENITD